MDQKNIKSVSSPADVNSFTEVFDPEFHFIYDVPTASITHFPPERLNITRLVFCRNFDPQDPKSCAMDQHCKFVHVTCDLSQLTAHPIHVNYIWRSEELCTYPRLPAGERVEVLLPNKLSAKHHYSLQDANTRSSLDIANLEASADTTVRVPSDYILLTEGTAALARHLEQQRGIPIVYPEGSEATAGVVSSVQLQYPCEVSALEECVEFNYRRMCRKGPSCPAAHIIVVSPNVKRSYLRAPARPVPGEAAANTTESATAAANTANRKERSPTEAGPSLTFHGSRLIRATDSPSPSVGTDGSSSSDHQHRVRFDLSGLTETQPMNSHQTNMTSNRSPVTATLSEALTPITAHLGQGQQQLRGSEGWTAFAPTMVTFSPYRSPTYQSLGQNNNNAAAENANEDDDNFYYNRHFNNADCGYSDCDSNSTDPMNINHNHAANNSGNNNNNNYDSHNYHWNSYRNNQPANQQQQQQGSERGYPNVTGVPNKFHNYNNNLNYTSNTLSTNLSTPSIHHNYHHDPRLMQATSTAQSQARPHPMTAALEQQQSPSEYMVHPSSTAPPVRLVRVLAQPGTSAQADQGEVNYSNNASGAFSPASGSYHQQQAYHGSRSHSSCSSSHNNSRNVSVQSRHLSHSYNQPSQQSISNTLPAPEYSAAAAPNGSVFASDHSLHTVSSQPSYYYPNGNSSSNTTTSNQQQLYHSSHLNHNNNNSSSYSTHSYSTHSYSTMDRMGGSPREEEDNEFPTVNGCNLVGRSAHRLSLPCPTNIQSTLQHSHPATNTIMNNMPEAMRPENGSRKQSNIGNSFVSTSSHSSHGSSRRRHNPYDTSQLRLEMAAPF